MKHNAAIYLLSSRTRLLELCLKNLFDNWNCNYDYPVHVHYFNDIYSKSLIKKINKKISNKIYFHQIDYKVPSHIQEKELFYNRKEIDYVKKSFPKSRLGYLHGERFWLNISSYGESGCLVKEMAQYKYLMRIDDDSNFHKKIDFDLFDKLQEYPVATAYMYNRVTTRVIETRINLWNFYKKYLKKYNYIPKNKDLREAVLNDDESKMHSLYWTAGNCNLYNMEMFKNSPWEEYLQECNYECGHYKYRWGDLETIGLFAYTHFDKAPYNFNLKEAGLYLDKFPSILSSYAPGVDSSLNVHNSFIINFFSILKYSIKKMFLKNT
jgi:hypothetical protein